MQKYLKKVVRLFRRIFVSVFPESLCQRLSVMCFVRKMVGQYGMNSMGMPFLPYAHAVLYARYCYRNMFGFAFCSWH